MTLTLGRDKIVVSPENVAREVQELARGVAEQFFGYIGQATSFECMMRDYALSPNHSFDSFVHHRAFSLNNPLVWLQTSVSVLMDIADSVDEQMLGLEDIPGLALRGKIDEAVALARHLVGRLAQEAKEFGICADAPLFAQWPNGSCNLGASNTLAE